MINLTLSCQVTQQTKFFRSFPETSRINEQDVLTRWGPVIYDTTAQGSARDSSREERRRRGQSRCGTQGPLASVLPQNPCGPRLTSCSPPLDLSHGSFFLQTSLHQVIWHQQNAKREILSHDCDKPIRSMVLSWTQEGSRPWSLVHSQHLGGEYGLTFKMPTDYHFFVLVLSWPLCLSWICPVLLFFSLTGWKWSEDNQG